VKILIDAQLPPGLKLMLAEAGHEALHVVDVGLRDMAEAALAPTASLGEIAWRQNAFERAYRKRGVR
jgi:predicted nuclease of predicted toxin-antitoxin system